MADVVGEFLKPRIVKVEPVDGRRSHARISLEPLERGFGHTLGNALRRILLSSMSGCAVTEVEIQGVLHEYTTLEGVQEDVLEILLNLKELAISLEGKDEATFTLAKVGPGPVTAGDIALDHSAEIANPDLVIANLTGEGELSMSLTVRRGRGYEPATQREAEGGSERPIGKLPLDASFSPVRRVAIDVPVVELVERAAFVTRARLDGLDGIERAAQAALSQLDRRGRDVEGAALVARILRHPAAEGRERPGKGEKSPLKKTWPVLCGRSPRRPITAGDCWRTILFLISPATIFI